MFKVLEDISTGLENKEQHFKHHVKLRSGQNLAGESAVDVSKGI